MGYSIKYPNSGADWGKDIEFPGVLKKEHVKIPGIN